MKYRLTTANGFYYPSEEAVVRLLESLGFTMEATPSNDARVARIWCKKEQTVEIEIKDLDELIALEKSFRDKVPPIAYGGLIINGDLIKVYDGYIE